MSLEALTDQLVVVEVIDLIFTPSSSVFTPLSTFETFMPIFPPLHSKPPPMLMVINKMLGLTTKRPLHWSSNGQQCALLFPLLHKRVAYAPYGCQIGFFKQQYFKSSLQTTP